MTAVMRAAAVPNPNAAARVPRVGVVIGGRIVDERLFRDVDTISFGTAEDATFTLPASGSQALPDRFVLLERPANGTKHYLRFSEGMSGRLAMGGERVELADLRTRAHTSRGAWRIELPPDARGKIVIGDVAFLFQLVAPPPAPSRPHLPLGVLEGLGAQVDWRLAIIAAMSFLLHFALASGAYSDWMDPVVDTDRTVAALIDMKRALPDVPVEVPVDDRSTTKDRPAEPTTNAGTAAKGDHGGKTRPTTTGRPGTVSDDRAADLAAKADAMQMGMLVALNGGPATKAAIDRSEIPPVDLTSAAQSQRGVAENPSALDMGRGGQPTKSGQNGLASLATGVKGDAKQGPGNETDVAGPRIDVDVRPPTTLGGAIGDADRVVLGLRSRFRKCYQDGLNQDPSMSGRAVLAAKVAPNGEVSSVDVVESSGLSGAVTSCMARVVKNATFTGNGGFATVRIPVTFVQQR